MQKSLIIKEGVRENSVVYGMGNCLNFCGCKYSGIRAEMALPAQRLCEKGTLLDKSCCVVYVIEVVSITTLCYRVVVTKALFFCISVTETLISV